jgi:hypothetical protein
MGSSSPGGGGVAGVNIREPIDKGILTNVSVFADTTITFDYQTFVVLSITSGGTSLSHRLYHLGSGFISIENPFSWNGFITILDGYQLLCRVLGNTDPVVRVQHQLVTTMPQHPLNEVLRHALRSP